MYRLECEVVDSLMRPTPRPPVLSVVIPTWRRPKELTEAVVSIGGQVGGELDGKVEIIITDNASGPETTAVLTELAETDPCVNYMIHAHNEGGQLQIYAAPARARGRWTWVFGDDDALAEGTLAPIVELLEREQPAFVTLNRQVWNPAMDTQLQASKHSLPDTGFDSMLDFLAVFGFDQLSFLTSQVYASEAALTVDPAPYMEANSRYGQCAYYVEAFHGLPTYYSSLPSVRHRWDPGASDTHSANFLHLATTFPDILQVAADKAGLQPGLFERIGGRRRLTETTRPLTFVDNIIENLWRCLAVGVPIEAEHWVRLEQLSSQWTPDHAAQLKTAREVHTGVGAALSHYRALVAEFRQLSAAGPRTPEEVEMLQQLAAAAKSLAANIDEARKAAFGMAGELNG